LAEIHAWGEVEVRPAERRLLLGGEPAAIGARAFDVLLALIERHERVVSKAELLTLVWPGVVVEENNLTVQISALRKLLGPDAIATVAGRGYRFAQPLQPAPALQVPVPAPLSTPRHNLPAERSSFVGRRKEAAGLRRALAAHRLVTLTGIGGAGKTRLALHVGALEVERFPDGVFFIDLAAVADPDLVAPALASACGLAQRGPSAAAVRAAVVSALAAQQCLLVLDNCEHLLDAVADLVEPILAGCPRVVLLTTSREALGVEGEQIVQLPSLSVPAVSGDHGAADPLAEDSDAMRLFADRALAVSPSFVLDAGSAPAVAEICRHLDGIPLAIEFAAARVAHLSPSQIAERLDDRFRLLTGARRRIPRQQTLGAALDWSHDLLSPTEQTVFRRLAVFAGSFSLAAAEAVCAGEGIAADAVLDRLGSLVAKSLALARPQSEGAVRYQLLETVRMYAADKLAAAGEADRVRGRHRDTYVAWLEGLALADLAFEPATIDRVGVEVDNLRAAAQWSMADDRPDLLAVLVSRMFRFWFTGSAYPEARRLLARALVDEARLTPALRVACYGVDAVLAVMALDLPAVIAQSTKAIECAKGEPDPFLVQAYSSRGFGLSVQAAVARGDPVLISEARSDALQAVDMAQRALGDPWLANAQRFVALVEMHVYEFETAARWFTASVQTCERSDPAPGWQLLSGLGGLAGALYLLGRQEEALAAALRFLDRVARWTDGSAWTDGASIEIVPALWAGGRHELAQRQLERSAGRMRNSGVHLAPNQFLVFAADLAWQQGRPVDAGRLLGAARALGGAERQVMSFRTPATAALYIRLLPLLREALGPEGVLRARQAGRALSLDEAFALALRGEGATG